MDELALLAGLLEQRRGVIADHALRDADAAAHLTALQNVSERIAACVERLGTRAPGRLRHFLENCSYDKALAFLIQSGIHPAPPVD